MIVQTRLYEATLQQISQITDGTYHNAENAQDLHAIYNNLNPEWWSNRKRQKSLLFLPAPAFSSC